MIRRKHSACTFRGAAKLSVLRENCARRLLFQRCSTSFVFFYSTTSTGAVLLWVSFLLLGQMKTSRSFVARVFSPFVKSAYGVLFCLRRGIGPRLLLLLLFIIFCSPKPSDHKPRCCIILDKISGPFMRSDRSHWRCRWMDATGHLRWCSLWPHSNLGKTDMFKQSWRWSDGFFKWRPGCVWKDSGVHFELV